MLTAACGKKSEKDAFAAFAGIWAADTSSYDGLIIDEDGNWELYKDGGLYSSGELDYHSDDASVWISPKNNTQWSRLFIEDDGSLYATPIGYFRFMEGEWDGVFDDDWRDSGIIVGRGFINREDVGEVYVLVTVDENGVSFYLDEREQCMVGYVFFPMTIPDAQDSFYGVSFDDRDGDGASDVSITFAFSNGQGSSLVWFWDPEDESYVFQEDWSILNAGSADPDEPVIDYSDIDFNGCWEYDDGSILLVEDDNWFLYSAEEHDLIWWGPVEYEGGAACLKTNDGTDVGKL